MSQDKWNKLKWIVEEYKQLHSDKHQFYQVQLADKILGDMVKLEKEEMLENAG